MFLNKKIITLIVSLLTGILLLESCEKEFQPGGTASSNPKADAIDPGAAAANQVITLTGSGLGAITSIIFDSGNVSAAFNPNFNTDNAVIFRVPIDAVPASQNIVFTNSSGTKFSVPFTVLGLPAVTDVSNYNYAPGDQITITGKNLADVTKVILTASSEEATIVSKTNTSLVVSMPTGTTVTRTSLTITNAGGTLNTTQEFVNVNQAYLIFTEGYMNGFENASWGPATISSTVAKSGSKSFAATYQKGNWSADGFASWSSGVEQSPDYKFLSFWVKGGAAEYTLYITGDKRAGGYGNSDQTAPITVPANVWTYFKIPLTTLELWKTGTPFKQLGFWIKGPDAQDETFYFDDVMLIK